MSTDIQTKQIPQLPVADTLDGFSMLGTGSDGKTYQAPFSLIDPLFGVTQEVTDSDATHAPSSAAMFLKLYGTQTAAGKEIIPYSVGTALAIIGDTFYYQYSSSLVGIPLGFIHGSFTMGTFTIVIATGVRSVNYTVVNTFSFVVEVEGEQTFPFPNPITLTEGQEIGFGGDGDTSAILFVSTRKNPIAGGCYGYDLVKKTWSVLENCDLAIGVSTPPTLVGGDITELQNEVAGLIAGSSSANTYLTGKTFSVLGDSISTDPYVSSLYTTWWKLLISQYGMVLNTNNSISGSTISTKTNGFVSRAANLGSSPDYIFIFGGTNDYYGNVALGAWAWGLTPDTTTFYGALQAMLTTITTNYPHSKIVFMTPLARKLVGSGYTPDNFPISHTANGAGVLLTDYADAIKDACKQFFIQCVDNGECGITYQNVALYTVEGVHPTDIGKVFVVDNLIRKIS